jgi:hypothetical protein
MFFSRQPRRKNRKPDYIPSLSLNEMKIGFFCLLVFFCHCSKKSTNTVLTSENQETLNKSIENELGTKVERSFNSSKTYLLTIRIKEMNESFTRYAVFEVGSGKLVQKGTYTPGHIKWINDSSLELFNVPGIIPKGKLLSDYTTIIYLEKEK